MVDMKLSTRLPKSTNIHMFVWGGTSPFPETCPSLDIRCPPKLDEPIAAPWRQKPTVPKPSLVYQLAFFTPGKLPASACNRKLYCQKIQPRLPILGSDDKKGRRRKKNTGRTLDILKSLRIPLPLPPRIHLFRIWVGRV